MKFKNQSLQDVVDYYDKTTFDYKYLWANKENLAMHFGHYDQNVAKHALALSNTNNVISKEVNIQSGEKILDAGSGMGGSCFWLAKNLDVQVTGITLSEKQVDFCNKKAAKLQLNHKVDFQYADFCNTPFEDETFDVVWACESFCHAFKGADFYKEAFRILKPKGRIIIADYIKTAEKVNFEEEKLISEWFSGWAMSTFLTQKEHLEIATSVGFQETKVKNYTSSVKVSTRNVHHRAAFYLRFGKLLTFLKLRSETELKHQIACIKQYEALEKNLWFYGIVSAEKP